MKILVTGATGFIGRHVARAFLGAGYEVRALVRDPGHLVFSPREVECVQGDVQDPGAVQTAARGCDAVAHVAAHYAFWARDPRIFYNVNVGGTRNVLEAAARCGAQRVVYTSSVSTVRFLPGRLGTEAHDPRPHDLVGHYKRSKYLAEVEARRKAAQGVPVVTVNPTAPVGPEDTRPTPTGRIVLDFLRGRLPAYVDTGLNLVDVADVARGHVLALERGRVGERYVLGNRNLTLREVLGMLAAITGRSAPGVRIPYRLALLIGALDTLVEGGLGRREPRVPLEAVRLARVPMWVECSKAIKELDLPRTPVEDALEQAVSWFYRNGYVRHNLVGMVRQP